MSGYNAEYTAPRETELEDLPATLAPIELVEEPKPYAPWDTGTFANLEELDKARLLATVRELRIEANKPIQADDHRIAHIWEQAGEIADQKGYCDVFDSFMDELGTGYAREESMVTYVTVTVTVPVYTIVRRGSEVEDYIDSSVVEEAFNNADIDITNDMWSIDYSESAE